MKRFISSFNNLNSLCSYDSQKDTTYNESGEKAISICIFLSTLFFADEIGGDNIELRTVVPYGVDSHDYEPSMDQLKDIENAQLFIYNGANFESWGDKVIGYIIDEDKTINASELSMS